MRQLHLADVDLITFSPRFGALDSIPRRTLTVWMKDRDWAGEDVLHGDWLRARHELLVRSADVVTGVSDELVSDCRALGIEATRIPNGCDTEHYGRAKSEPTSIHDLGRPRILFSGAWNWRVDGDLLAAVADRLPDFTFVVLGVARVPVPSMPNVHHVPAVPYAELPGYLQAGDVGIVPYRSGAFNAASCPLKVYEYLAAGLPVVTSGVDTAGLPSDLVQPVDDLDGFVRAVAELARRDARASCRDEAAKHSWDVRAQSLLRLIDAAADASVVHSTIERRLCRDGHG
jgi:glycosyltransferase involved in cell wall biosynthesis